MSDFIIQFILISTIVVVVLTLPIVVFSIGNQKKWKWPYRWISLLPLIIAISYLVAYIKTPSRFYFEEYQTITQLNFPKSGEFQYWTTSGWSFNGDHSTAFVVEMDRKDLRFLKKKLDNRHFDIDKNAVIPELNDELDYIQSKIGTETYSKVYTLKDGSETIIVAFLPNNESVLFYHSEV